MTKCDPGSRYSNDKEMLLPSSSIQSRSVKLTSFWCQCKVSVTMDSSPEDHREKH